MRHISATIESISSSRFEPPQNGSQAEVGTMVGQ